MGGMLLGFPVVTVGNGGEGVLLLNINGEALVWDKVGILDKTVDGAKLGFDDGDSLLISVGLMVTAMLVPLLLTSVMFVEDVSGIGVGTGSTIEGMSPLKTDGDVLPNDGARLGIIVNGNSLVLLVLLLLLLLLAMLLVSFVRIGAELELVVVLSPLSSIKSFSSCNNLVPTLVILIPSVSVAAVLVVPVPVPLVYPTTPLVRLRFLLTS